MRRKDGKYVVIISLMIFLFIENFILIPVIGTLAFSSADLVMVKRVMSLGCTIINFFGSRVTVSWSRLSTSMSMEHS